jgi:2-(3-amino-3-carboxypropyl)histidine synthase
MITFDFEEDRIKREIKRSGAKRVLLQMPQGLKPQATKIAQIVEACGATAIISIDPCYGACDIAFSDSQELDVDLIIHFGHVMMVKQGKIPVLYVEAKTSVAVDVATLRALSLLVNYKRIGLATSVQHLETLNQAKHILSDAGKDVYIGDAGQLEYAGQVIGCNYSNVKAIVDRVDAYLFIGGGVFHALGIALATSKPTIIADPYDNRAFTITKESQKLLKQRFASILESKKAKTFGVLVGLKPGQKHFEIAMNAKIIAEKHGLSAFLLSGKELTPESLLDFPAVDAYVNTACPRISLDSPSKFQKPMLTVNEFMVVCGEVSWHQMLKKGLFEN